MIAFPCPHCDKPLQVKDELAGKKGKCPSCGKPIAVAAASENLAATTSDAGRVSPGPRNASEEERTIPPRARAVPEAVSEAYLAP